MHHAALYAATQFLICETSLDPETTSLLYTKPFFLQTQTAGEPTLDNFLLVHKNQAGAQTSTRTLTFAD